MRLFLCIINFKALFLFRYTFICLMRFNRLKWQIRSPTILYNCILYMIFIFYFYNWLLFKYRQNQNRKSVLKIKIENEN